MLSTTPRLWCVFASSFFAFGCFREDFCNFIADIAGLNHILAHSVKGKNDGRKSIIISPFRNASKWNKAMTHWMASAHNWWLGVVLHVGSSVVPTHLTLFIVTICRNYSLAWTKGLFFYQQFSSYLHLAAIVRAPVNHRIHSITKYQHLPPFIISPEPMNGIASKSGNEIEILGSFLLSFGSNEDCSTENDSSFSGWGLGNCTLKKIPYGRSVGHSSAKSAVSFRRRLAKSETRKFIWSLRGRS